MELNREYTQLLNYAYRYLSYRMRTRKELESYLLQKSVAKNINVEHVKQVMEILIEERLVDDEKFIEEFVTSRINSKPKSEYVLTLELLKKGVSRDDIERYFEKNTVDEYSLAKKALLRKWSVFKQYSAEKCFKKSADFLQRRGFSFTVIKKTIEEMESSE